MLNVLYNVTQTYVDHICLKQHVYHMFIERARVLCVN